MMARSSETAEYRPNQPNQRFGYPGLLKRMLFVGFDLACPRATCSFITDTYGRY